MEHIWILRPEFGEEWCRECGMARNAITHEGVDEQVPEACPGPPDPEILEELRRQGAQALFSNKA
jgi:hypothetical protein